MSDEIQQNRYDQMLRRVTGIIGPGSKVAQVITELFPMIDMENPPGELFLLGGTRLGSGGARQIGAAGERPRVQLFNPVDSGLIATLTTAIITATTTLTIRYTHTTIAENTNTFNQRVRDLRLGAATRTTCEIRAASDAAALSATGEFIVISSQPFLMTDPNGLVVLPPGSGITFSGVSVATTVIVTFFWRERVAEASELNL